MILKRWIKIMLIVAFGLSSQSVFADLVDMSDSAYQDCLAQYERNVCELRCQHSEAIDCHSDCEGEEAEHVCHYRILKEQESGHLHEWSGYDS